MKKTDSNIVVRWLVLLVIGTSISFSTLHSHHEIKWNHFVHQTDSGQCFVENTNLCPICGYLFNAQTVDSQKASSPVIFAEYLAFYSEAIEHDFLIDQPNGRSPPALI